MGKIRKIKVWVKVWDVYNTENGELLGITINPNGISIKELTNGIPIGIIVNKIPNKTKYTWIPKINSTIHDEMVYLVFNNINRTIEEIPKKLVDIVDSEVTIEYEEMKKNITSMMAGLNADFYKKSSRLNKLQNTILLSNLVHHSSVLFSELDSDKNFLGLIKRFQEVIKKRFHYVITTGITTFVIGK